MKISDYLKKEFCIMNLKATKKEEAIRELASSLVASGGVKDKEKFINDILEREGLGSTGIGYKVAIPHSRTNAVEGFIIAFGKSKSGIDFNALDGDKVNLIFLMGANPHELSLYLRLLAELSKLLMDNTFRKELFGADSQEQVLEIFKKFEG